ncbi:helicase HerA-like domain-containing protein [Terrihabitans sp. B22-R8]|uniref:helicase HerA-like domain-containing protein n=1 Tax=Terrihabitans sp. B22-R8 TaxID=3425128 RepID=UPI00403CDAE0
MDVADKLFIGTSTKPEYLALRFANRHGLITGATGTGKTVTLQVLAEGFSNAGVPVFAADVKGDLAGLGARGEPKDFLVKRAAEIGLDPYVNDAFPVILWDLYGEQGAPVRTTVTEMGPLLLSRLLNLNDVQEGVLNIVFRVADQEGLLLLDLKDLQALLTLVGDTASQLTLRYGNISKASIGAIQRQLLILDNQGGTHLFGEPALQLSDMMQTTREGRGMISILAADRLMQSPRLYGTFLLWLLSELFEELPEVGDLDKPKLVLFFDEAHLLFDDAPDALLEKIEQVVRLVRSKGVGVYFVTQNPLDVPDRVSSQLGNRIQHALRAYTPREQKAVRAAATTFRANPAFSTEEAITQMAVGEALVSTLEDKGVPSMVERTLIRPPASRLGPLTAQERQTAVQNSPVSGHYDVAVDRTSAYEVLRDRSASTAAEATNGAEPAEGGGLWGGLLKSVLGIGGGRSKRLTPGQAVAREVTRTVTNRIAGNIAANIGKSVGGSVGGSLGRAVVRGALGGLLRR